jgi:flagellar hook-associated protein 2
MAEGLSVGSLALTGGPARITGTSSKLDTESIVAAAYEARRLPAVRLEQRITGNEARGAAFGELRGLLQSLKDALGGLRNPPGLLGVNENLFDAKQVSVTGGGLGDPSLLVDVTAENRAVAGSFTLEVEQLATAHKLAARPFAVAGQTLSEAWNGGASFAGTLELGLANGAKATVAVDGSMGVEDLRAAINAVSAQSGVTASVLTVSPTEQRLILTAAEAGRAIELGDAGGDPVTGLLGGATLQAPQGSRVVIDGVVVERAGNRIDDALAGVSIDLYGASPGTEMTIKSRRWVAPRSRSASSFPPTMRCAISSRGSPRSGRTAPWPRTRCCSATARCAASPSR